MSKTPLPTKKTTKVILKDREASSSGEEDRQQKHMHKHVYTRKKNVPPAPVGFSCILGMNYQALLTCIERKILVLGHQMACSS